MNILDELTDNFSDALDVPLCADKRYQNASAAVHEFAVRELSPEHAAELERLTGDLTSALFQSTIKAGMQLGARIVSGLLSE